MPASMNEQAISFPSGDTALSGLLSIPAGAKAIVVFAHGSGSNSRSTRNADTARMLYDAGLASLRADLLTNEESALNERTGQFRFDVKLLSERVLAATAFVGTVREAQMLPIAYYGASTGAAAALTAAAMRWCRGAGGRISRIVFPMCARQRC
jgi:putative phosphoribosyl transferase